jgi:hypothetical protein
MKEECGGGEVEIRCLSENLAGVFAVRPNFGLCFLPTCRDASLRFGFPNRDEICEPSTTNIFRNSAVAFRHRG